MPTDGDCKHPALRNAVYAPVEMVMDGKLAHGRHLPLALIVGEMLTGKLPHQTSRWLRLLWRSFTRACGLSSVTGSSRTFQVRSSENTERCRC
jgi:hypothetical protein